MSQDTKAPMQRRFFLVELEGVPTTGHLELITGHGQQTPAHLLAGMVGVAASIDNEAETTVIHIEHGYVYDKPAVALPFRGVEPEPTQIHTPKQIAALLIAHDLAIAELGQTLFTPEIYYLGCAAGSNIGGEIFGTELMKSLLINAPADRFATERMITPTNSPLVERDAAKEPYRLDGEFVKIDRACNLTPVNEPFTETLSSFGVLRSTEARLLSADHTLIPRVGQSATTKRTPRI